jgi:phosphatidylglycerol:prolipoprotein diacylglycerol transferase
MAILALRFTPFMTWAAFGLTAHWILETLGYAIGFWLYRRARRQSGDFLSSSTRLTIVTAAIVGAAVGSKVLSWLEDPVALLTYANALDYLASGRTIVGGLLGGTLAVEWIKWTTGVRRRTGDLFAIPLTLAIAFGRIGCFLGGLTDHTYGFQTSLPWGVDFGDGIPRHPTQIYELLFMLLLAMWIKRLKWIPHREGDLYRTFLTGYLGFRFVIDFIKPDARFAGLTAIQWSCALGILAYWRDIPFLVAPFKGFTSWVTASGPTSSTTPQPPSAPNATGVSTEK